jgi:benzoate transport
MTVTEIKQKISNNNMNLFQIFIVTICFIINLTDGFGVLSIAFAAPSISEQFALNPKQLGELFSAGFIGMVTGALLISPLADKLGRRFVILCCLFILATGMFASGFASSYSSLLVSRVYSGLGMGAILPAINTVVAEYSSNRHRSLVISVVTSGYTAGILVGGMVSIYIIKFFGWQYIFYMGSFVASVMFVVAIFRLPESLDFILLKGKRNEEGLIKLNRLLNKLNISQCQSFPEAPIATEKKHNALKLLFSGDMLKPTLLLCTSTFMLMCSFYFLASWMPKILVGLGHSTDISISISIVMNLLAIIGGILLGWLSKKYTLRMVTAVMLALGFVMVTVTGLSPNNLPVLFVLLAFTGFTVFGAMPGLYAMAPEVFPPEVRATGTGIVAGIARLGAALGPYLAGLLIAANTPRVIYFFLLALPLLFAAISIFLIKKTD